MRLPRPFRRDDPPVESRAAYGDAVVAALLAAAANVTTANPLTTAALESAAGWWARSLAAAELTDVPPAIAAAIDADVRAAIGRALIRHGEFVAAIEVSRGGLVRLAPAASHDVDGGVDPSTWIYRLDLFGPTGTRTLFRPPAGVVHLRWQWDAARPWIGLSPLAAAAASGTLAANLERVLAEETSGAVGSVLPVPDSIGDPDDDDDPIASLRADIRQLKGKTAVVESMAQAWGDGTAARPLGSEWTARRIGPMPPPELGILRDAASRSVLAACGVPLELGGVERVDGTAAREAYRRFIVGAVSPMSKVIAAELGTKLNAPAMGFEFGELAAADIASRGRALRTMTEAGIGLEDARALAGL